MKSHDTICHEGIVREYTSGRAVIILEKQSACASCHAKGACSSMDSGEKEIEAFSKEELHPGDRVVVEMSARIGWVAVVTAFVIPSILMISAIIAAQHYNASEGVTGVAALGAIGLWYVILFFFRDKMKKNFIFTARKINNSN